MIVGPLIRYCIVCGIIRILRMLQGWQVDRKQIWSSPKFSGDQYVIPENWHDADQLKFEALRYSGCKAASAD